MEIRDEIGASIEVMETLTGFLEQETVEIRAMRTEVVSAMADRKNFFTRLAEARLTALRERRTEVAAAAAADPDLKARFDRTWTAFNAATRKNAEALRNAEAVTRRVIDLVIETAKKQHNQTRPGYGPPNLRRAYPQPPISVSINTKF